MNRIIVSTNIRNVSSEQTSGNLYIIDLDDQKILQTTSGIEVPDRQYDSNPRGGMRGMRGIGIYNGELAAAIYSSILVFDPRWNLLRSITHPSVAAIHEIDYSEQGPWVTSTANDTLVRCDQSGALTD